MLNLSEAQRIAAAYPPGALHTPRWERERHLTATQQLAWLMRFDPDAAAEMISANKEAFVPEISDPQRLLPSLPHTEPHPIQISGDPT